MLSDTAASKPQTQHFRVELEQEINGKIQRIPLDQQKPFHDLVVSMLDNVKKESNSLSYTMKPDTDNIHYVLSIESMSAKDILLLENMLKIFDFHSSMAKKYMASMIAFYKQNPNNLY